MSKNIRPTELTWEQKNPVSYLRFPTDATERLNKTIARIESGKKKSSAKKLEKSQKKVFLSAKDWEKEGIEVISYGISEGKKAQIRNEYLQRELDFPNILPDELFNLESQLIIYEHYTRYYHIPERIKIIKEILEYKD